MEALTPTFSRREREPTVGLRIPVLPRRKGQAASAIAIGI
jgi:hypothetical protein